MIKINAEKKAQEDKLKKEKDDALKKANDEKNLQEAKL